MSNWLEEAIKTMPSQNAGGAPTATPEQLFEFHDTVTRYRTYHVNANMRNARCYYTYSYRLFISTCRSETPKTVTHALRNFARLYR